MITQLYIRQYLQQDADQIAALFHASVHAIDSAIYSEGQKEAWAPTPPDYLKWHSRLEKTKPYVAVLHDRIVGFAELELTGHIDCLYVHPNHQRIGVARALLSRLITDARRLGVSGLHVEASKVAVPFFELHGFAVTSENRVVRGEQTLINFSMERATSTL